MAGDASLPPSLIRKAVANLTFSSPGIFIIEGAITCGVCLIGRLIIVDFPHKADGFLKPEEKQFVIDRINNDRGDAEEDSVTLERILHHLKDWKLYVWAFNLMASTLPGYAYSYFKTIILMGMGFTNTESQLLSAPPYILAAATTYLSGWLTDKYQIRGPVIAVHQLLTAVGMIITAYGQVNGARYFGVFLGISSWSQVYAIGIRKLTTMTPQASVFFNSAFPASWLSKRTTSRRIPNVLSRLRLV